MKVKVSGYTRHPKKTSYRVKGYTRSTPKRRRR